MLITKNCEYNFRRFINPQKLNYGSNQELPIDSEIYEDNGVFNFI